MPVSAPYLPPVHTDGQQGEYVEGDSHVGDVVVDPAVNGAKDPNSEIKFDIAGERERETHLSLMNMKLGIQLRVLISRSARVRLTRK